MNYEHDRQKNITDIQKLRKLVGNKFFSVDFIKKNGDLRSMKCRLGVTKHLKGGELTYLPEEKGMIVVFDMELKAYRTININTIQRFKVDGIEYNL